MDSLVGALREMADRWSDRGGLLLRVILLFIAGLALAVGGRLLMNTVPYQWVPVTMGSVGGMIWFCAGYITWYKLLPDDLRDRLNIRGNVELPRRRITGIVIALAWFAVALLIGKYVGGPVVGALTVAILLGVWRMGTATPEEWDMINAEAEAYAASEAEFGDEEAAEETLSAYQKPKRRKLL